MTRMKYRISPIAIVALLTAACGTTSEKPGDTPAEVATAETPQKKAAPAGPQKCCADYDDLRRLDGQQVVAEGIYKPVHVMKRPRRPGVSEEEHEAQLNEKYGAPSTVQLRIDDGPGLMLGIYYEVEGSRPDEEIAKYAKKRVRITGTVHLATPSQTIGEEVMQTMIGPYLDVETIELVE